MFSVMAGLSVGRQGAFVHMSTIAAKKLANLKPF